VTNQKSSCVLLADRHHGLRDGVRGLETERETVLRETVFMVADEAFAAEATRDNVFPFGPYGRI
jgi:hypothetical protein